jgi:hypothetical protein
MPITRTTISGLASHATMDLDSTSWVIKEMFSRKCERRFQMSGLWRSICVVTLVLACALACSLPIGPDKDVIIDAPAPPDDENTTKPTPLAEAESNEPAAAEQPGETTDPPPSEIGEVDSWALWMGATHLRGANIHQRKVYPEIDGTEFFGPGPVGPPYTQEDFNKLAALGANYVNISHPGLFTEEAPFVPDEGIIQNLDHLLKMIRQADMFAVISFRTGPGRSEYTFFWDEYGTWFDKSYLNDSVWGSQGAQEAWADMWKFTAERYRDDPIVVGYDLMVEPNSNETGSDVINDYLDIWDPEEFQNQYSGTLYDWNQMTPPIVQSIREVDNLTPILIGGNGYSGMDWLPYIEIVDDPYIVYAVHQYTPTQYSFQWDFDSMITYPGQMDLNWDGEPDPFNRNWLAGYLNGIKEFWSANNYHPVVVNEYGVHRWVPGAAEFMDDEMSLFEELGVNYALWYWCPDWEPLLSKQSYFTFTYGSNPESHSDVPNELQDIITKYWRLNYVRPSHPLPEL